ncbi:MAG TPA: PKD domain-containing protein [Thermoanaerobaculia bacterium]|nr:PKD domain-containing protein [Thermoanaerobaculia bacterium]
MTASRLVSTRASVPNLVVGPAAWSGSVLAVAKREEGNDRAIWLAIYGETLETLIADRRVVNDAAPDDSLIDLVWNGTEFGLFYRTEERIHLQRLSLFGESIGAPVVINPSRRPRTGDDIDVLWSDALDAWVVARHISSGVNRGIWLTLLNEDGSERSDLEIPAAPQAEPHLAIEVTETGVIGLFYLSEDDNMLVYTRVLPGKFPVSQSVATAGTDVHVTAVNDLFVVARMTGTVATAAIRWFVIDSDLQFVRPDGVLIATNGVVLQPLGLTATDDELALSYATAPPGTAGIPQLHLHRFTLAGALISDVPFAGTDITAARALATDAPTWTGEAYVTPAVRESSARLDSYLVRYCPLQAEIAAPRVVLKNTPVTITAIADGGSPEYDYEWNVARDPGGSDQGPSIQRTFPLAGTFLITLDVTDETGASVTTTFTIEVVNEIEVPKPPKRRAVRK